MSKKKPIIAIGVSKKHQLLEALLNRLSCRDSPVDIGVVFSDRRNRRTEAIAGNHSIPYLLLKRADFIDRDMSGVSSFDRKKFSTELYRLISRYDCDAVVLSHFMTILDNVFVSGCEGPIVNVHPSLKYRGLGRYVIQRAILDYRKDPTSFTGSTIHLISEDDVSEDSGIKLASTRVNIDAKDTKSTLEAKLNEEELSFYPSFLIEYFRKLYILKEDPVKEARKRTEKEGCWSRYLSSAEKGEIEKKFTEWFRKKNQLQDS